MPLPHSVPMTIWLSFLTLWVPLSTHLMRRRWFLGWAATGTGQFTTPWLILYSSTSVRSGWGIVNHTTFGEHCVCGPHVLASLASTPSFGSTPMPDGWCTSQAGSMLSVIQTRILAQWELVSGLFFFHCQSCQNLLTLHSLSWESRGWCFCIGIIISPSSSIAGILMPFQYQLESGLELSTISFMRWCMPITR